MSRPEHAGRFGVVLLLLVLILLAVSNPAPAVHKQAIRDELERTEPLASALGLGILSGSLAHYESYLICSRMVLNDKTVTFGMLGHVWVDHDALEKR